MDINEKICVITGGASGIGLESPRRRLGLGWLDTPEDEIDWVIDVNLKGVWRGTSVFAETRWQEIADSFAVHAPYTPESEKYNVLEVIKRLRTEND